MLAQTLSLTPDEIESSCERLNFQPYIRAAFVKRSNLFLLIDTFASFAVALQGCIGSSGTGLCKVILESACFMRRTARVFFLLRQFRGQIAFFLTYAF